MAKLFSSRFDYFKLLIHTGYDEAQRLAGQWREAVARSEAPEVLADLWKVKALGQSKTTSQRMYALESWGRAADYFAAGYLVAYTSQCERLDFRLELPTVTENDVKLLGVSAMMEGSRYNVNLFNSKPRGKAGGGSTGGIGFALGSHKSDVRVSLYKRQGATAALEVQVTGAVLQRLLRDSKEEYRLNKTITFSDIVTHALVGQMTHRLKAIPNTTAEIAKQLGVDIYRLEPSFGGCQCEAPDLTANLPDSYALIEQVTIPM